MVDNLVEFTVPTVTEFTRWLKRKMEMTLEEYMSLPEESRQLIYMSFRLTGGK